MLTAKTATVRTVLIAASIGLMVGVVRHARTAGAAAGGAPEVGCGGGIDTPSPQGSVGAAVSEPEKRAAQRRQQRAQFMATHVPTEAQRHPFVAAAHGFTTRLEQFGAVRFAPAGVTFDGGVVSRLASFGRVGASRAIETIDPVEGGCDSPRHAADRCAHRLEYRRGAVTEWWAHTLGGLEQGFDIAAPPAGGGDLVLEIALDGASQLVAHKDGRSVLFADGKGARIGYAGLSARDADGKALPARMELAGSSVRLVVSDAGARYPIVVDPIYTTASWTYAWPNSGAEFGYAMANVGDVNGDTHADLVIGAPYDSSQGYSEAGAIMEFHGLELSTPFQVDANTIVYGAATQAALGYAIAGAGDVNGDGVDDLLVGAPDLSASEGGDVYIFKGVKTTGALSAGSLSNAWFHDNGYEQGNGYYEYENHLGWSVAGGVDENGDGYADILVGRPGYDYYSYSGNYHHKVGEGNVWLGGSTGMTKTKFYPGLGVDGDSPYAYCGSSVAMFNTTAVAVGCPGTANADWGQAIMYTSYANQTATTWGTYNDTSTIQYLGATMANAGDVNGDGYDDIVVGAPEASSNEGAVYLGLGSANGFTTTYTVLAPNTLGTSAACGTSLAGVGDVDGDGYDDVAVGCPGENVVYILYGAASSPLITKHYVALDSSGNLGSSVAGGHYSNNTYPDLVVGQDGYNGSAGRILFYPNSASTNSDATDSFSSSTVSESISGYTASGTYTLVNSAGRTSWVNGFKWWRASDSSGTGKTEIATTQNYTLQASDDNMYLKFCVQPDDGVNLGSYRCSGWASVGPVVALFSGTGYSGSQIAIAYSLSSPLTCFYLGSFVNKTESLEFWGMSGTDSQVLLFTDGLCATAHDTYVSVDAAETQVSPVAQQNAYGSLEVMW